MVCECKNSARIYVTYKAAKVRGTTHSHTFTRLKPVKVGAPPLHIRRYGGSGEAVIACERLLGC